MIRADYVKEMVKRDINEKKKVKAILIIISVIGLLLVGTIIWAIKEVYTSRELNKNYTLKNRIETLKNREETKLNRKYGILIIKRLDSLLKKN